MNTRAFTRIALLAALVPFVTGCGTKEHVTSRQMIEMAHPSGTRIDIFYDANLDTAVMEGNAAKRILTRYGFSEEPSDPYVKVSIDCTIQFKHDENGLTNLPMMGRSWCPIINKEGETLAGSWSNKDWKAGILVRSTIEFLTHEGKLSEQDDD